MDVAALAEVVVAIAGPAITLSVTDRGPGIPADEIEQVLQPFYRMEASRNRDTGRSGLGLAIARSIAEGHGGRLSLEPGPTEGLRVTLILPLSQPPSR